jgi:hypothetical protein
MSLGRRSRDDEGSRPALIDEADALVREILWITEQGRCYCCSGQASDAAHLFGRRYLRLRFDVEKDGNVHLLCRECHHKDHERKLFPGYQMVFISKAGAGALAELMRRMAEIRPMSEDEMFDIVVRLRERRDNPYPILNEARDRTQEDRDEEVDRTHCEPGER